MFVSQTKLMKRITFLPLLFILFFPVNIYSQEPAGYVTRAIIIDGDTIPIYVVNPVKIFGPMIFKNKYDVIQFSRLVKNVKKVYPYALITAIKVREYEQMLMGVTSKKEKKQKLKKAEEELKLQFEDDIKNLTDKQGIILIKLIDRETGSSSYELIKEFKGRIMAVFWQSLGSLFGYNLKDSYDPEGEDKDIEKIVIMIENGAI